MITFLGDVALLSNDYQNQYFPDSPFIFNLEYCICDDKLIPAENKVNLRSDKADFFKQFNKKPIAVTVSNNHIFDYGEEGYLQTIDEIKSQGIEPIDNSPTKIMENLYGIAYSLCGGEHENICFSKEKAIEDFNKVKMNGAGRIVCFMHWGIENQPNPSKEQIELGHWLIDHGADLVIGNHPHCIQPIETYKNGAICYSLGNFLFPDHDVDSHYDSNGIARRRWHTRWCSWNRKCLVVVYNEEAGCIDHVEELQINRDGEIQKTRVVNTFNQMDARHTNKKIRYLYRKYALFLKSNVFVEKKIIEMSAFKNEILSNIR